MNIVVRIPQIIVVQRNYWVSLEIIKNWTKINRSEMEKKTVPQRCDSCEVDMECTWVFHSSATKRLAKRIFKLIPNLHVTSYNCYKKKTEGILFFLDSKPSLRQKQMAKTSKSTGRLSKDCSSIRSSVYWSDWIFIRKWFYRFSWNVLLSNSTSWAWRCWLRSDSL